jgi:hypothetical protein
VYEYGLGRSISLAKFPVSGRRGCIHAHEHGALSCSCSGGGDERTVDKDNTVSFHSLALQIEPVEWRDTMAGCKMIIHQHLDHTITLTIGTRRVGHYTVQGKLLMPTRNQPRKAVVKTQGGKVRKVIFL